MITVWTADRSNSFRNGQILAGPRTLYSAWDSSRKGMIRSTIYGPLTRTSSRCSTGVDGWKRTAAQATMAATARIPGTRNLIGIRVYRSGFSTRWYEAVAMTAVAIAATVRRPEAGHRVTAVETKTQIGQCQ